MGENYLNIINIKLITFFNKYLKNKNLIQYKFLFLKKLGIDLIYPKSLSLKTYTGKNGLKLLK